MKEELKKDLEELTKMFLKRNDWQYEIKEIKEKYPEEQVKSAFELISKEGKKKLGQEVIINPRYNENDEIIGFDECTYGFYERKIARTIESAEKFGIKYKGMERDIVIALTSYLMGHWNNIDGLIGPNFEKAEELIEKYSITLESIKEAANKALKKIRFVKEVSKLNYVNKKSIEKMYNEGFVKMPSHRELPSTERLKAFLGKAEKKYSK